VAVSARATISGLASIVAPISAAIAIERANRADMAIGGVKDDKDDMVVPFLDSGTRLSFSGSCTSTRSFAGQNRYAPVEEVGLTWAAVDLEKYLGLV
jgi:hypothetical protein